VGSCAGLFGLVLFLLAGCTPAATDAQRFSGTTMGTTYQVMYRGLAASVEPDQQLVEALLAEVNQSLSTYIDSSVISTINAGSLPGEWFDTDEHFRIVFERSREIYGLTGGAFDPSVGPLVSAFGFGPDLMDVVPDSSIIDSLVGLVDFESFLLSDSGDSLQKGNGGASLDFSAIAKGYGVDVISEFFDARGTNDYFVEIGGEVRTRGQHPEGRPWRVGIERPSESALSDPTTQEIVQLGDAAMATSGNYRNFYVSDGQKYVHTIDPATGYPKISSLLSASVTASSCMTADGLATAFMVMGAERAMAIVEADPTLEAFFVVAGEDGAFLEMQSSGFSAFLYD